MIANFSESKNFSLIMLWNFRVKTPNDDDDIILLLNAYVLVCLKLSFIFNNDS